MWRVLYLLLLPGQSTFVCHARMHWPCLFMDVDAPDFKQKYHIRSFASHSCLPSLRLSQHQNPAPKFMFATLQKASTQI